MANLDWVPGDRLGLDIPAHAEALRAGGEAFLTRAFRAFGSLTEDNRVTRITHIEECPGGSTGRKLFLSVAYEKPGPGLLTELFVKFSRDFDNEIRDRGKDQLEAEALFAPLSRMPGFPIRVPLCMFADYQHDTQTGLVITERIFYGADGVEHHYEKGLDYEVPDLLAHYRALVRAIARLAGSHKGRHLPAHIVQQFPFDPEQVVAADRIPYDKNELLKRIGIWADFAAKYPRLVPANIAAPAFIARLSEGAVQFLEHEAVVRRFLRGKPEFVALCHWNAHIDNAWFWHNAQGELECGLLDWARVGQMYLAASIWGCVNATEPDFLQANLDELLRLFVAEFHDAGGPAIALEELKLHLCLHVAILSLAWLLDAPIYIERHLPNLDEIESRFDPRFAANERARSRLLTFANFLYLWEKEDCGRALDLFLGRTGHRSRPALHPAG